MLLICWHRSDYDSNRKQRKIRKNKESYAVNGAIAGYVQMAPVPFERIQVMIYVKRFPTIITG